jgi:hypothetical protein
MTQEELDYYEDENDSKNRYGKWSCATAQSNKEFKIAKWLETNDPWDDGPEAHNSRRSWKIYRKTQYRIKKQTKSKSRKSDKKEHWRYKKPFHACNWTLWMSDLIYNNRKK